MCDRAVTSVPRSTRPVASTPGGDAWPARRLEAAILLVAAAIVGLATHGEGQMAWTDLSPAVSPSPRNEAAMAYDSGRRRMVLFGGVKGFTTFLNETWEYDGVTWVQRKTTIQPTENGRLAYDPVRRKTVFVGWGTRQVWEWDGVGWTQRKAVAPVTWDLVYDPSRRRIVSLAQNRSNWSLELWEWDGQSWTRRSSTTALRVNFADAAFDTVRQVFVVWDSRFVWEWNGLGWTRTAANWPVQYPVWPDRSGRTYDCVRQRLICFGGELSIPHSPTTYLDLVWEWDGRAVRRIPARGLPGRSRCAIAYDFHRGRTVVFGGRSNSGPWHNYYDLGDTWEYAPADLRASTHTVSVKGGGNVMLSLFTSPSHANLNYLVLGCMDAGFRAGIPLAPGVSLGLLPDWYFRLTLAPPPALFSGFRGVLDRGGQGTAVVRIPAGLPTAWIGARFLHAYVVYGNKIDYASTPVPLTLVP